MAAVLHIDSVSGRYEATTFRVSLLRYVDVELDTELDAEGTEKYLD